MALLLIRSRVSLVGRQGRGRTMKGSGADEGGAQIMHGYPGG